MQPITLKEKLQRIKDKMDHLQTAIEDPKTSPEDRAKYAKQLQVTAGIARDVMNRHKLQNQQEHKTEISEPKESLLMAFASHISTALLSSLLTYAAFNNYRPETITEYVTVESRAPVQFVEVVPDHIDDYCAETYEYADEGWEGGGYDPW